LTNKRDGLSFVFHDGRHGWAAPLAQRNHAAALAALVLAQPAIDPDNAMICRPDVTAKPTAVDFDDPLQNDRGGT